VVLKNTVLEVASPLGVWLLSIITQTDVGVPVCSNFRILVDYHHSLLPAAEGSVSVFAHVNFYST